MVLTRPYYDRFLLLFLALFMIFWFWVFYYFHSRPRSLCSLKSDNRGPHQKILSFTYFGTKDRFKEGTNYNQLLLNIEVYFLRDILSGPSSIKHGQNII